MKKADTKYIMTITCGQNRMRLLDYEMPREFSIYSDTMKRWHCKQMAKHYKRCGQIIKLFAKSSS